MSDSTPTENPSDFLTPCTSSNLSNPVLEEVQARAAEVVLSIHRLAKISLVHAMNNEAVSSRIATTHATLSSFTASIAGVANVTFIQDTIFVCGELLRASRGAYESAAELGALLEKCGIAEVTFSSAVTPEDLFYFAEAFSMSVREHKKRQALLLAKIPNVTVRAIKKLQTRSQDDHDLPLKERALRTYASALYIVRKFYDAVAAGANLTPHRVKRVAQKIVGLAEESESTLLGLTTLSQAQRDDANRAVHAAILVVVMARQITKAQTVLSKLTMAALLADAGRAQVAGPEGRDRLIRLSDSARVAVPRCAGAMGFVTGGVNSASALRSVLAFETTWLEEEELLGLPYQGRMEPLFQSQILRIVRALLDLVAPRDISEALSPFDALCVLAETKWVDRALLRVLIAAVGLMPPGTQVEFEGGERGVVLGPSDSPNARHLPKVRLLTGGDMTPSVDQEFDLGSPDPVSSKMKISRVLSP